MEIQYDKDGNVIESTNPPLTKVEGNGSATEVNTAADADVIQGEVLPDERTPNTRAWKPLASQQKAAAENTTAVVPATRFAPPAKRPTGLETSDDSISLGEIIIPTLNIVQNIGNLKENFDEGAVVFDKKHQLAAPPKKSGVAGGVSKGPVVELLVIGFRPTRYVEKIPGGEQGRIFSTESDVFANGGTTDYKTAHDGPKQIAPYFQALATALVLVRAPKDFPSDKVEEIFPFECLDAEGSAVRYGVAQWHLRGSAHTAVARPLKTARKLGGLKGGYTTKVVTFQIFYRRFAGSNAAFVPEVSVGVPTSDSQRELASEVLTSLTSG